jgi:hypothetical protein
LVVQAGVECAGRIKMRLNPAAWMGYAGTESNEP